MKKRIITSIATITIIGGVTAGALMNQPKTEQPKKVDSVKVETAPKAIQEPKVVETVKETTQAPEVPQSALETVTEPVIEQKTREQVWAEVYGLVQSKNVSNQLLLNRHSALTSVIMNKYETKPELFTESALPNTVDTCLAFYDSLYPDNARMKEVYTSINIAKGECGL